MDIEILNNLRYQNFTLTSNTFADSFIGGCGKEYNIVLQAFQAKRSQSPRSDEYPPNVQRENDPFIYAQKIHYNEL